MEVDGFITKANDNEDKRIVRIFLTEKGVEHRRLIKKIVLDFNQRMLENIDETEMKIFYKVFDQIKKQINAEMTAKSKK
jgi:DNA-binding MarR family transcriptional regulator